MGRRWLLAALLSTIAGSADAVGLLGFGLFTAHITGNLAVLAVHLATGRPASVALLASIPVFVVVVVATRWFADRLAAAGHATLRPLLAAQLLLFAGFVALTGAGELAGFGGFGGRQVLDRPPSVAATVAVLLAVAAMAVQNALVQISLAGTPPTAVMTTNLTRLTMAATDLAVLRRDHDRVVGARAQAGRAWPLVAGFLIGAAAGAAGYALVGWWSVALPGLLAAAALAVAERP
jgi:uncharacterized membrane protein YoaK (UPF0700 family)